MITDQPKNWKDLQEKVYFIFHCIGLLAEKEKVAETPRGTTILDVFAIDPKSIDKVKYVVECKNWNKKVPQSIIHSFMTVMSETGSNIGYIISKKGFQKGAIKYTKSTNIKLFTYNEFQNQYFNLWYERYFAPEILKINGYLIQFTEPINSRRFGYQDRLNEIEIEKFESLIEKYSLFSFFTSIISNPNGIYINIFSESKSPILSLKDIQSALFESFKTLYNFNNYIDALETIKSKIKLATEEFIAIFGTNIFIE
jgi:restriction system protein